MDQKDVIVLNLPGPRTPLALSRFLRDDVGATAIEYVIIAGGISIVIVAGVRAIGTTVSDQFTAVSSAFK